MSTTLASGRNSPQGITVSSGYVFWTEFNSNQVAKVAVAGGSVDVLAQNQDGPSGIAVADQVYWTTYRSGTADRVPIDGGVFQTLGSAPSNYVGMATDGRYVFWTIQEGSVMAYSIARQTISLLAKGSKGAPWSIATDGVNVYWNEVFGSGDIFIVSTGVNGGSPTVLGQVTPDDPAQCPGVVGNCQGGVATDGQAVYFTLDADVGSVWKVPVSGGTPVAIAKDQYRPYGIAVDGACVYWGNWDGSVMVAPK